MLAWFLNVDDVYCINSAVCVCVCVCATGVVLIRASVWTGSPLMTPRDKKTEVIETVKDGGAC